MSPEDSAQGPAPDPPADGFDRVVHEPARLRVLAHLYVVEEADLTWLRSQTGLTWGNIASHVNKLEEAAYVEVRKEFVGRKPNTMLRLTELGRRAFEDYRAAMQKLLG